MGNVTSLTGVHGEEEGKRPSRQRMFHYLRSWDEGDGLWAPLTRPTLANKVKNRQGSEARPRPCAAAIRLQR